MFFCLSEVVTYQGIYEGAELPKSKRMQPWISLAKIILDSGLTPESLTDCLLEAWKKGEAASGRLHIEKRLDSDGKSAFLFIISDKVVGQFPLDSSLLERPLTVQNTIKYALERFEKKGRPFGYKGKKQNGQ